MMRLFVALSVDDESLQDCLAELQEGLPGVRWIDERQFHLTLNFIGEVEKERIEELKLRLEQVRVNAGSCEIEGLGVFPSKGMPRVLWMGANLNETLKVLQKKTLEAIQNAGLEMDKRKFAPHITLARMQRVNKNHLQTWFARNALLRCPDLCFHQFHLYSSTLHKDGAIYQKIASYDLEE